MKRGEVYCYFFIFQVDFEQFKDVLILVLSSTNTDDPEECLERPGNVLIMSLIMLRTGLVTKIMQV